MASYIGHYQLMGYSYLAVEDKASQQLIGTVGLWNSAPWPEPELGYWLLPESQGKGYGMEAGLAVKAFAQQTLKLASLVSYIDAENEPSKRLALRLGARLEGEIELLEFGPHEVYRYW
jgi:RimJ/RimL family protein N-acetyltransferase